MSVNERQATVGEDPLPLGDRNRDRKSGAVERENPRFGVAFFGRSPPSLLLPFQTARTSVTSGM